ncbi:MAG: MATE family efflux transporter [Holdemanella sp.]|nr:MATE family efflux transporter [Holdemanella sp.]
MESQKENVLGTEPVGKLLLKLALPAVVSQLVNMLYNIVDRIYIGHIPENGVAALTGLGLCFPILMLISAFASLYGMGGAPQAAIAMGQGDNKRAERILGNCFSALIITSIVLTIVFLLFGKPLLMMFGASNGTIEYAWSYLAIYVCGTIFVQLALGLNMFITTQGFASKAMVTVLIGAGLNTILDPIFIYGFHLGVQGAAYATVISQAVSAFWVLRFLTGNKTTLKIKVSNMRISWKIVFPIVALGLSPFIMQSTESILNICFNTSLQKYGGDLAVGTMTILSSVGQLLILPLQGITQGAQPIISFNYGAGKSDRVKQAIKIQLIICISFTTLVWALIELFPTVFIRIFNSKEELLTLATWALRVYAGGMFMMGAQIACQQSFVALGQAKTSLLLACLRKLVLLIPLIYILPQFMDNKVLAVFLAEPVSDILAATITSLTFAISIKKLLDKRIMND